MDDRLVFAKTPKGVAEVATRGSALGLAARRVLIMIDGKRSVAELAGMLRSGDLEPVVSTLEAQGYIRATGDTVFMREDALHDALDVNTIVPPPAPEAPEPADPAERSLVTLEEAKRRAVRELTDRMGPDGEIMAVRIEQARSGDELRDRLREAERLISGLMGQAAAQEFLRALRTMRR